VRLPADQPSLTRQTNFFECDTTLEEPRIVTAALGSQLSYGLQPPCDMSRTKEAFVRPLMVLKA
jgi:hypothetical protein